MRNKSNDKTTTSCLQDNQTYKTLCRRAEIDDFRQANAAKRRAMWAGAIRYDAPLKDENGNDREDRALSDCGRGAEAIRDLGETPAWKVEMEAVLDTFEGVERRVIDALFADQRPQVAARLAGVNRQRVYRVMEKLRARLAKAHRLYVLRNA